MADATKAGCLFFSDKYVLKTLLMASSFYTPLVYTNNAIYYPS